MKSNYFKIWVLIIIGLGIISFNKKSNQVQATDSYASNHQAVINCIPPTKDTNKMLDEIAKRKQSDFTTEGITTLHQMYFQLKNKKQ
jgi:hypothetical protein